MCSVSNVVAPWTTPGDPNYLQWTPQFPSPNLAQQMLEVLMKLEEIDRRVKALDCKVEEQAKRKFKAKLKRRAAKRS